MSKSSQPQSHGGSDVYLVFVVPFIYFISILTAAASYTRGWTKPVFLYFSETFNVSAERFGVFSVFVSLVLSVVPFWLRLVGIAFSEKYDKSIGLNGRFLWQCLQI